MRVLKAGQALLGRITFKDGSTPKYDRPYLIVKSTSSYIEVLNVSSVRGKERKLAFPTNEKLKAYRPPFMVPSFVKLDSLTKIPISDCTDLRILYQGAMLDSEELRRIQNLIY